MDAWQLDLSHAEIARLEKAVGGRTGNSRAKILESQLAQALGRSASVPWKNMLASLTTAVDFAYGPLLLVDRIGKNKGVRIIGLLSSPKLVIPQAGAPQLGIGADKTPTLQGANDFIKSSPEKMLPFFERLLLPPEPTTTFKGNLRGDRALFQGWEHFSLEPQANSTVAFRFATGYLRAGHEPENFMVTASARTIDAWERWRIEDNGDGTVSLRSAHNRYLVVEDDTSKAGDIPEIVRADRMKKDLWEKFYLQPSNGLYVLKSKRWNTFVFPEP
jgi:hypothetical protein